MTDGIQTAIDYLAATQDKMMEDYKELIRFPSISADPSHADDVSACADWIVLQLKAMGFDNCEAVPTAGHPVVYGEWLKAGADKPTVLVYAHYDVQPVDPLPLWHTKPFEGVIKERKLYARGASDNKAGVWGNLKTFEALLRTNGALPVNVKIMFEGEEESGSPSIEAFVMANKERLRADVLLNCDGDLAPDSRSYTTAGAAWSQPKCASAGQAPIFIQGSMAAWCRIRCMSPDGSLAPSTMQPGAFNCRGITMM